MSAVTLELVKQSEVRAGSGAFAMRDGGYGVADCEE